MLDFSDVEKESTPQGGHACWLDEESLLSSLLLVPLLLLSPEANEKGLDSSLSPEVIGLPREPNDPMDASRKRQPSTSIDSLMRLAAFEKMWLMAFCR